MPCSTDPATGAAVSVPDSWSGAPPLSDCLSLVRERSRVSSSVAYDIAEAPARLAAKARGTVLLGGAAPLRIGLAQARVRPPPWGPMPRSEPRTGGLA